MIKEFYITIRFRAAGLFIRMRSRRYTSDGTNLLNAANGR